MFGTVIMRSLPWHRAVGGIRNISAVRLGWHWTRLRMVSDGLRPNSVQGSGRPFQAIPLLALPSIAFEFVESVFRCLIGRVLSVSSIVNSAQALCERRSGLLLVVERADRDVALVLVFLGDL